MDLNDGNYMFLVGLGFICMLMWLFNAISHYNLISEFDALAPAIVFPLVYVFIIFFALTLDYLEIGYRCVADEIPNVIYYFIIGLIAYLCGNLIVFFFSSSTSTSPLRKVMNDWNFAAFFKWSLLIAAIGSTGVIFYYTITGVPLFGDVDRIRHATKVRTYGIGFSLQLLQGLNFILLTYLVYRYKSIQSVRNMLWMVALIGWIAFLTSLTGFRWINMAFILSTLTAYHYIIRKIKIRYKSIFLILIALIIIASFHNLMGYHRAASRMEGIDQYLYNLESINIAKEYAVFSPFLISLQIPIVNFSKLLTFIPEQYDFFYGKYNLAHVPVLQKVIPALSRDNIGIYVTNTIYGLTYEEGPGGTALSIIGSLYIDYGLPAIIVGMLLMGIFLEMFYLKMIKVPSVLRVCLYSIALWTVVKWIISGIYTYDLLILLIVAAIVKFISIVSKAKVARVNLNSQPT